MVDVNQANPGGEPSQQSFQARAQARLERESTDQPQENDTSSAQGELEGEPDAQRETDEVLAEESETDHTEAEAEEEAVTNEGEAEAEAEADPDQEWEQREAEWQAKVDKAEEARKSMERDYRRKTHKLSEHNREVADKAKEVEHTAEYFSRLAEQDLQRFQGVNWQQLQSNPEQYQQAQQAWMQAQQTAQQRKAELQQVREYRARLDEESKARIAEHSKSVLMNEIPGWGGDVYQQLRDYAENELDYSGDEFDQIVDWRLMKAIHSAYQSNQIKNETTKVIKKVRKSGKRPQGRTAGGQPRNALGQFEAAAAESRARPGDREAWRKARRLKLEMERGRR